MNRLGTLLILSMVSFANGCSRDAEKPLQKSTVKVTGVLTVNGEAPPWKVLLEARPVGGIDSVQPSVSVAETQDDGSFEFSTYSSGDGVPEGSYALLAKCQIRTTLINGGDEPPDKLGGKYNTVGKSPKKFEVPATGEPIDLGTIDIKANIKKAK